ncbi:unnamed protein product [Triticum turgidum subsp. durum]|uniref:MIF4G domain-containing protein n=1 Tax=Triticum turgidum subsp. durum TaxID=4567 RepID=A0A9R0SA28_TRITD|nr:unnamed protein product [Triticum turgidum subsp. durum]
MSLCQIHTNQPPTEPNPRAPTETKTLDPSRLLPAPGTSLSATATATAAMSAGWRTLLLRIGDRCPEYGGTADHKEHIEICYNVLSREYEHSKDDIFEFLLQCAEQLPHKIPFFGVLIGLINLENEDFAKGVVDATQANLQDALHTENRDRIRILLRFLCGLVSYVVVLG